MVEQQETKQELTPEQQVQWERQQYQQLTQEQEQTAQEQQNDGAFYKDGKLDIPASIKHYEKLRAYCDQWIQTLTGMKETLEKSIPKQ